MRYLLILMAVTLVAGCMPARQVAFDNIDPAFGEFVEDRTEPSTYPAFAAAEGNIYSCRYGISMVREDEFIPPKAQLFGSLLAHELPGIEHERVVLHRLDVYNNAQLRTRHLAGQYMGGFIGHTVSRRAREAGGDHFISDRMLVDSDPANFEAPEGENAVGCDDRGEGEYYASMIGSGYSALVTWMRFDVDNFPFHIRTFYQHQSEDLDELAKAKREAMGYSVRAAAREIELWIEGGRLR
jgi:hypothetical protein